MWFSHKQGLRGREYYVSAVESDHHLERCRVISDPITLAGKEGALLVVVIVEMIDSDALDVINIKSLSRCMPGDACDYV